MGNHPGAYDKDKEYNCSPFVKSGKFTPLMFMANNIKQFDLKYFEANILDINAKNEKGWTALMIAARNSNTTSSEDVVQLLLEHKADPNLKDNSDSTALMFATAYSGTDSCSATIGGANSSEKTVQLLLDNKADPNFKDIGGCTALMYAARYSKSSSSEKTVKLLLDNKADPNLKDNDDWTALMDAIKYSKMCSSEKTVQLLLDNKADPNFKYQHGMTALMFAVRNSGTSIVQLLLNHKADPNLRHDNSNTALMLATEYGSENTSLLGELTVELLLDNKADPNLKTNDGWTALMLAAANSETISSKYIVQLLLNHKADPNSEHNDGRTALILAANFPKTDYTNNVVQLLLNHNADFDFTSKFESVINYISDANIIYTAIRNGLIVDFSMVKSISRVNDIKLRELLLYNMSEYELNRKKYKKMVTAITPEYIAHFRNKPGSFTGRLAGLNFALSNGTINTDTIFSDKLLVYLLSIGNPDDCVHKINLFINY